MSKVLFLDVDGVLNMMGVSYYTFRYKINLEPHLVRRLEFILERVEDLKIVVSSSWGLENLKEELQLLDFKYLDSIIGRTPREHYNRGEQILQYVKEHNITEYMVLEDEIIDVVSRYKNDKPQPYEEVGVPRKQVIEVDMNEGLSNENCLEVIRYLNYTFDYGKIPIQISEHTIEKLLQEGYRPSRLVDLSKLNELNIDHVIANYKTLTIMFFFL